MVKLNGVLLGYVGLVVSLVIVGLVTMLELAILSEGNKSYLYREILVYRLVGNRKQCPETWMNRKREPAIALPPTW